MKCRVLQLLALTFAVILVSGCASSSKYDAYRMEMEERSFLQSYADTWQDWFADLSDIASMELSAGEGLGVNVQPTKLLNAGFGFEDVLKVGWRNRGFGFYNEKRKEGGLAWFYYRDMTVDPVYGTLGIFERNRMMQGFTIRDNSDRHWMDVGAEAHLVYFGASAFVSPKEALDFVGNTLTLPYNVVLRPIFKPMGLDLPELDLSDDDKAAMARKKHGVELINAPDRFEPAEVLDRLMDPGY